MVTIYRLLTGDKVQTAIEIGKQFLPWLELWLMECSTGFSCNLLKNDMDIMIIPLTKPGPKSKPAATRSHLSLDPLGGPTK